MPDMQHARGGPRSPHGAIERVLIWIIVIGVIVLATFNLANAPEYIK